MIDPEHEKAVCEGMSNEELTAVREFIVARLSWLDYEISRRKGDTVWVREWIIVPNPTKPQDGDETPVKRCLRCMS